MKSNESQTWSWSPEQEPPQAFEDALALCSIAFEIHFPNMILSGYAEGASPAPNCTTFKRPIIDFSDRSGEHTLKSRYVQHPAYFLVNVPVVYWPHQRKESP